MKKSADLVSSSLMVDNEINNLFSNFSIIEASGYKSLITDDLSFKDTYKIYRKQADSSFLLLSNLSKDYPEQLQYLDSVRQWKDSLDLTINNINKYRGLLKDDVENKLMAEVDKMASIFEKFKSLKLGITNGKETLFKQRIAAYKTETGYTPLFSLLLAVFSLFVFWLAFKKLNNSRKDLISSQGFVDSIISNSSHVITYLSPVKDDSGIIVDFIFEYVSNKIEDYSGISVNQILNKKLSEKYPESFKNGIFKMYTHTVKTGKTNEITYHYKLNGKDKWFKSVASKLEEGVNVTTMDVTQEKNRREGLKKLNENLFTRNVILSNAEVIAKIGSFTRFPESEKMEMSDNLFRLLGFKTDGFVPNLKNYLSFVHPEDKSKLQKSIATIIKSKRITKTTYRVITAAKVIRHFKSTNVLIVENDKEKIIGVIQDITDSLKKDEKLIQKNKALERYNIELNSFNRVVSHDLQEPIRKIQMFISLLTLEVEQTKLSDKSLVLLDKINYSAERMQLLIKNLLTYSRIDSSSEDFVKINLNDVFKMAKDNLSERIEESNMLIVKNDLPIIRGISFQIEQLFTNLISNAIKYKSLTKSPKITIDASIVNMPLGQNKKSQNYHEIKISDNGIGFEQENSKKIFEIFERLHQDNEYSGTGIGLAIVKKIIDNHQGFIYARGKINIGATFYLYLPA